MAAEEEQVLETAATLADLVARIEGLSGREDFDAELRVQFLDDGFVELLLLFPFRDGHVRGVLGPDLVLQKSHVRCRQFALVPLPHPSCRATWPRAGALDPGTALHYFTAAAFNSSSRTLEPPIRQAHAEATHGVCVPADQHGHTLTQIYLVDVRTMTREFLFIL